MKKSILLFCVAMMNQLSSFAQTGAVTGIWLSENKDAKIEVYQQGTKLFGKIIWLKEPNTKDDKNPDPALRNKPVLGSVILTDFKQDSDTEWSGGKIYDPESGKTYSCKMKLREGKLELRGYVGISMFGRTSVWTRA